MVVYRTLSGCNPKWLMTGLPTDRSIVQGHNSSSNEAIFDFSADSESLMHSLSLDPGRRQEGFLSGRTMDIFGKWKIIYHLGLWASWNYEPLRVSNFLELQAT